MINKIHIPWEDTRNTENKQFTSIRAKGKFFATINIYSIDSKH